MRPGDPVYIADHNTFTEDDARRMICPLAMNRPYSSDRYCVGASCMAWVHYSRDVGDDEPEYFGRCGMLRNGR